VDKVVLDSGLFFGTQPARQRIPTVIKKSFSTLWRFQCQTCPWIWVSRGL